MSSNEGGGGKGGGPGNGPQNKVFPPAIPKTFPNWDRDPKGTPPHSQGSSATPAAPPAQASSSSGQAAQSNPFVSSAPPAAPPNTEAPEEAWARVERNLPKRELGNIPPPSSHSDPDAVQSNFFQFTIQNVPNKPLYRYSIHVGDFLKLPKSKESSSQGSKEKRKLSRETKRYLISQLLKEAHNKPDALYWVCDYESTIISVGHLYNTAPDGKATPYERTGPKNEMQIVNDASISLLGQVNIHHLNAHINRADDGNPSSETAIALDALNIILWRKVNHPGFNGARGGKRFYPAIPHTPRETASRCYILHQGFFSSVRPGSGSLHLNVSTTTSAFFKPMVLLEWMNTRWPSARYNQKKFKKELKNVRVKCNLTKAPAGKRWIIRGDLGLEKMSEIFFGQTNVRDHMFDGTHFP